MLLDLVDSRLYINDASGCKTWAGPLRNGRPNVTVLGRSLFRALCWEKHGPPPNPDSHAAHLCHNPKCINPDHSEWQAPELNNPANPYNEQALPVNLRKRDYIEIDGVKVTIKQRVSNKGDGRVNVGWCAVFRWKGTMYKSGAYGNKSSAERWAKERLAKERLAKEVK